LNGLALNSNSFLCGRIMCNTEANVNSKSAILEVLTGNGETIRVSLEINDKEL